MIPELWFALSSARWSPPKKILWALVLIVLLMAGCNRSKIGPSTTPAFQATSTPAPPSLNKDNLLVSELSRFDCDSSAGASISCQQVEEGWHIDLTSPAGDFVRWRWYPQSTNLQLSGLETLHLQTTIDGDFSPNLYMVEADGDRVAISLLDFGSDGNPSEIFIPLSEFVDREGHRPDFSSVVEMQIVVEWADAEGSIRLEEIGFLDVWEEEVALSEDVVGLVAELIIPDGFVAEAIADNLAAVTQIAFTPSGDMLVSLQEGRIWRYWDEDGDDLYDHRSLYASGYEEVVGLLHDPLDEAVWIGGRGQLYRTEDTDEDGVADTSERRIDDLPWGRHQNNGLIWNAIPDPFTGEDAYHWIYFGLGSTGDLEDGGPINSTVLRFPRHGQSVDDLEVVSRGNRNVYDLVWAPVPIDFQAMEGQTAWQLFASENGPDFENEPDEVNHILWQHDYGFPEHFGPVIDGEIEGQPYTGPVYSVAPHASASGVTYISNPSWPPEYRTLYVTLFGQVFSEEYVGHTVEGVEMSAETLPSGEVTYRGQPFDLIDGLIRPLPLTADLNGDLVVGDYATGAIYRVRYAPQ